MQLLCLHNLHTVPSPSRLQYFVDKLDIHVRILSQNAKSATLCLGEQNYWPPCPVSMPILCVNDLRFQSVPEHSDFACLGVQVSSIVPMLLPFWYILLFLPDLSRNFISNFGLKKGLLIFNRRVKGLLNSCVHKVFLYKCSRTVPSKGIAQSWPQQFFKLLLMRFPLTNAPNHNPGAFIKIHNLIMIFMA